MARYVVETEFLEELFTSALRKTTEQELGKLLGYRINMTYRVRRMRRGKVSLDRDQVAAFANLTGTGVKEILRHSREVYVRGPYARGRRKR